MLSYVNYLSGGNIITCPYPISKFYNTLNWILPQVPTCIIVSTCITCIIATSRRYFISQEQEEVEIKSKYRQKKPPTILAINQHYVA